MSPGSSPPGDGAHTDLLIGTHNRGKVEEIERLLAGGPWRCHALPEGTDEYLETGDTFADNARGKALYYAQLTGRVTLADDSGLEIDALHGEPGVYSARYIDPELSQQQRNLAVLERLVDVADEARGARFVCHVVLALPDAVVHEQCGVCNGRITRQPHGTAGFGYDPIFRAVGDTRTFAELSREEKSRRSHRGKAINAMTEFLRGWSPDSRHGA